MRKLLLSAAVSLLTLGLVFRLVLQGAGEQTGLWPLLRDVCVPLVLVYVVCQVLQTLFRSERYRCLLRGSGEERVPASFPSFVVTLARNALVDLLPARAGELGYLALMNRGYQVGADVCLSAMAVSFLLDLVALAVVLGVAVAAPWTWHQRSWPLLVSGVAAVAVVSVVGALLLFALLPRVVPPVVAWLDRRRLPRRLRAAADFAGRVAQAVARVRSRRVIIGALLLSLGVRFFKYGGLYALFVAITRVHLPALAAAQARNVLPALLAAEGTASLPVPSMMGFGAYEGGGTAVWKAMGFDPVAAALAMLALHIVSQAVDYTLGALAGITLSVLWPRRGEADAKRAHGRRLVMLAAAAALLAAAAGFTLLQVRKVRKMGSLTPPPCGAAVTPDAADEARLRAFASTRRGALVWSSNRFGNHDILELSLPSLELRRLTTGPHVETFPRFSPDGRKVLFSRSQPLWVSQRNPVPWDTYCVDRETGQEQLIATHAFMANWTGDGRGVVFQRDGVSVVLRDLASGEERLLFRAGQPPAPAGVQLQTPGYDERTGRLVATLRGAVRSTVLYGADGSSRVIGSGRGCQAAWLPGAAALCSVEHGGRMGNVIYRHELEPPRAAAWLDLPMPYSHEYFPRSASDGSVLVLGAAARGHEHDTADYELFAWVVGTPPEEAVRLTFHTGNDCWPDLTLE